MADAGVATRMDLNVPPEILGAAGGAGLVGAAWAVVKGAAEMAKLRAEKTKLRVEARTAELLGEKAVAEAQNAGIMTLATIVAEIREELSAERTRGQQFRAAVLEFMGSVSSVLGEMPDQMRTKVQLALDKLRSASGWH